MSNAGQLTVIENAGWLVLLRLFGGAGVVVWYGVHSTLE